MTIIEAVKMLKSDPEKWARPVGWRGSRSGVTLIDGQRLVVVPNIKGAYGPKFVANYFNIVDDWEVVDPGEILDEV